eukprot:2864548-Prymnesium_polylepis.1
MHTQTEDLSHERREAAREQFAQVFVDYLAIACAAPVLLAPWRSRALWMTLNVTAKPAATVKSNATPAVQATSYATTAEERHDAAFEEFGQLLLDLPCIAMAAVVIVSGWRTRLLLRELKLTDPETDADDRRE